VRDGVASETARRVAAQRLRFPRAAADYGDAAADERLTRDVAAGAPHRATLMTRHLEGRTMFFDRVVVGAIDRGVTQVVIAAAGYDGRAWRYSTPGVRFFELDHPDTQADKVARVERLQLRTDHVSFVPADFATVDVAAALRGAALDPALPTLFTLEGVAIYLDKPVLAGLLSALATVAAPRSRLAISLSINGRGLSSAVGFRHAVARVGEPVKTVLEPDEVGGFLADAGWERTDAGSERARWGGLVVLQPLMR
jgi:methyltransferase (TIGR00027 family)